MKLSKTAASLFIMAMCICDAAYADPPCIKPNSAVGRVVALNDCLNTLAPTTLEIITITGTVTPKAPTIVLYAPDKYFQSTPEFL